MTLSPYLDYTLLEPTATQRDIIELCNKALKGNFHSICINGCYVALAKTILKETNTKVTTVIGFPFGASATKVKIYEAEQAIKDGAQEIAMVVNLGFVKSQKYDAIFKDIYDVKTAIGDIPLKVIIEVSELNKNEIVKVSEICIDAEADFIETSTGFSKSGTTLTAVKIIKKTIKNGAKIKASGDILDVDTAIKFLESGANRIGVTTNFKGLSNNRVNRNSKIYKQYLEKAAKQATTESLTPSSLSENFSKKF